MSEKNFFEGSASNNFGVNYSFGGKKINFNNQYYLYGTSIDHLINEKILKVPDYIKIDVDGIEHLILNGAKETLQNPKVKSLLIEVQEDFIEQFDGIRKILSENKFVLSSKIKVKDIGITLNLSIHIIISIIDKILLNVIINIY